MRFEFKRLDSAFIPEIIAIAAQSFSIVWTPRDFSHFILHECGLSVGLFGDDKVLAYFIGLLVHGDLDIISVATDPAHRRRGLSEKLLREVMNDARVKNATLEVDIENPAAIALYAKLGFTVQGKRKGYYQKSRDAYLMAWSR